MPENSSSKIIPLRAPRPCPECRRPSSRDTFPFCSKRCKDVDLNRWFSGAYAIPVTEAEENTEPSRDE